MVACPLCNTQIHSGKIEKNTTENFNWKVEEEDHDAVVNGGFGSTILMRRQEAVFVWWGGERRAETFNPSDCMHRTMDSDVGFFPGPPSSASKDPIPHGPVSLPANATIVSDADEEIFLLYTRLATLKPPDSSDTGTFTVLGLKTPRRTCYSSASSSNRHLPLIRLRPSPRRLTRTLIEETGRGNGRAPAVSLVLWSGMGTGLGRGGRVGLSLRLSCSSTSSFRIKRL